jgi:hypothetical protein
MRPNPRIGNWPTWRIFWSDEYVNLAACIWVMDAGKVERRIGRWQGRNPAVSRLLEAMVLEDEKQRAIGLQLSCSMEKGVKKRSEQAVQKRCKM